MQNISQNPSEQNNSSLRKGWKMVKLGDVCEKIQYGFTASAKDENTGVKFLRITDIVPDLINWKNVPYCEISEKDKNKYLLKNGDIIIARTGATTGYAKQFKGLEDTVFASYLVRLQINDDVSNKFIGKLVTSNIYKKYIKQNLTGSAQPQANAQILTSFDFLLPPLPTQKKIASILSAFDDLIEVNTKRIKLLEQSAELIYKEWFVKFNFPGSENVKMVESGTEFGEIPEGWEVKKVGDVYKTASGITPSRKNPEFYKNGSTDWIKTKELNNSFILNSEEKISSLALENTSIKIFPSNTVLIAMYGATIGKMGITTKESATNQACCAFLEKEKSFGSEYIFYFLRDNVENLISLGQGAAQQNISQVVIKNFNILVPKSELVESFTNQVYSIWSNIKNLSSQNKKLREIRDFLLPKLVSGAVDVENIKKELK